MGERERRGVNNSERVSPHPPRYQTITPQTM